MTITTLYQPDASPLAQHNHTFFIQCNECCSVCRVHSKDPKQIKPISCDLDAKRCIINSDSNPRKCQENIRVGGKTVSFIHAFINMQLEEIKWILQHEHLCHLSVLE